MARAFDTTQKALLRSADLHVNVLVTFFLDQGTYRFCDDQSGFDLFDGTYTYIGANAMAESSEIRASQALVAEQVTLTLDGNRMAQYGVADPARVLRDVMDYLHQQRRVDYAFGLRYSYSKDVNLVIPAYAGKISSLRLVDEESTFGEETRTVSKLEIVLDSLAARYNRATNRIRNHEDQLEIDPADMFYSYTLDTVANTRTVYWGRASPFPSTPYGIGTAGAPRIGGFNFGGFGGFNFGGFR